jgi:hypothetical protein
MSKPESKLLPDRQRLVDLFNREVEKALRGYPISAEDLPPEEAPALELAQRLSATDFSNQSRVQQSLRRRFSKRTSTVPGRIAILTQRYLFRDGRALLGIGVVAFLICVLAFGLVISHNISATPAYHILDTSAAMYELPAVSLTAAVAHNPSLQPQPVPTPMAISAFIPPTSPERTPALTGTSSGNQYPAITTTTSK